MDIWRIDIQVARFAEGGGGARVRLRQEAFSSSIDEGRQSILPKQGKHVRSRPPPPDGKARSFDRMRLKKNSFRRDGTQDG
jgi:hypothetical protein